MPTRLAAARIEGDDHPTVLFPRDKDATQSRFAVVNSASRGGFQLSETLRLASGTEQTASDVQPIAIRCRRRRRPAVNRKTVHYLLPAYLTHQPTYTSDVVTKLCRPIDQSSRHGRNRAAGPALTGLERRRRTRLRPGSDNVDERLCVAKISRAVYRPRYLVDRPPLPTARRRVPISSRRRPAGH